MKLDELFKPKELSDIRRDSSSMDHNQLLAAIHNQMTKYGFTKISNGAWADVYIHPKYPDSIFKIFNNDKSAKRWLTYAAGHSSNPFVPKVKSKPIKITETAYAVRMEKLEYDWDLQTKVEDFLYLVYDHWKDINDEYAHTIAYDEIKKSRPEFVHFLKDKNFLEVYKEIMSITKGGEPDLHHENFMFRGKQLVFTDPV